jgi:hypothetical protein
MRVSIHALKFLILNLFVFVCIIIGGQLLSVDHCLLFAVVVAVGIVEGDGVCFRGTPANIYHATPTPLVLNAGMCRSLLVPYLKANSPFFATKPYLVCFVFTILSMNAFVWCVSNVFAVVMGPA